MSDDLTTKQRKFIEYYDGNGTRAARLAGYSGNDNTLAQTAHDLLRNPKIVTAIEDRVDREINPVIADRQQRQTFWTQLMNDPNQDPRVRLRASELLGKSEADFSEKRNSEGHTTLEELLAGSYGPYEDQKNDTNSEVSE